MGKRIVKDVVVEHSEKPENSTFLKKKNNFLFSVDEIGTYGGFAREVLEKKRALFLENDPSKTLARGPEFNAWKLIVAAKRDQTQPFIVKYIGAMGVRCKICGKVTTEAAFCAWDDKFFNRETKQMESKIFKLYDICMDCLSMCKALYMHEAELVDVILTHKGEAQFHSLHDAKNWQCRLCNEHQTDSTWVHIPYDSMQIAIPVCERHFDAIIENSTLPPVNVSDGAITTADEWAKRSLLSNETLNMLKAFKRKKNKDSSVAEEAH